MLSLQGFVLFLHIAVVITSFMIAGALHAAFQFMPRAKTIAETRSWATIIHRAEPLLPILALGILGFGAWLVHLESADGVKWSSGWIITAVITLVVIEGLAGSLLAPRSKSIVQTIESSPDGDLPEDLRARMLDPVMWIVGHIATFGFLGMVFVMASKPSGAVAWLFPAAGAAIGVVLAEVQLRSLRAHTGSRAPGVMPSPREASDAGSKTRA